MAFEFSVSATWKKRMISIKRLGQRVGLEFPKEVTDADQFGKASADELSVATEFELGDAVEEGAAVGDADLDDAAEE